MYIYLITNSVNNKKYVGQTTDFNRRILQHKTNTEQLIDKKFKNMELITSHFKFLKKMMILK